MYVAHGTSHRATGERGHGSNPGQAATSAWNKINRYYEDGDFPATPSRSACRFCAFKDLCRSKGVPVPTH